MDTSNKGYIANVGQLVPLLEQMIEAARAGDTKTARSISNYEFTPFYEAVFRGLPLRADDGTNSPEMLPTLAEHARNNAIQGSMDVGTMFEHPVDDEPTREDFLRLARDYFERMKRIIRSLGYA